mmetsp:Transcript_107291/g.185118  ORF Transcript_107291/g.185118 Transcript_107291/m.185118 type:complete len:838 (-) Transcript_107291:185-2698(-)
MAVDKVFDENGRPVDEYGVPLMDDKGKVVPPEVTPRPFRNTNMAVNAWTASTWTNMPDINLPTTSNMDKLCSTQVPDQCLFNPEDKGSKTELKKLSRRLEAIPKNFEGEFVEIINELRTEVEQMMNKFAHTSFNTNMAPTAYICSATEIMEKLIEITDESEKRVRTAQKKFNDLDKQINASAAILNAVLDNQRPESPKLGPKGGEGEEGFRNGWRDQFWQHVQRMGADQSLKERAEGWKEEENVDDAAENHIQLLLSQLENAKDEHAHLIRMVTLDVTSDLLVQKGPTFDRLKQVYKEQINYHNLAPTDLKDVVYQINKLTKDHLRESEQFTSNASKAKVWIEENEHRQRELATYVQDLHRWYAYEKGLRDGTTSPKVTRLTHEVDDLMAKLEAKKEALRITQEEFECDKPKEPLPVDTSDLDEKLSCACIQLDVVKDILEKEHAAAMKNLRDRQSMEERRCQRMQELLDGLHRRKERLEHSIQQFGYAAEYVEFVLSKAKSVTKAITGYENLIHADSRTLLPICAFPGLEAGVQLATLLKKLAITKSQRVAQCDETIESETVLLEFCVDTQDPGAHKHNTILNRLLHMREQLQEDLESHARLDRSLPEAVTVFYDSLATFRLDPQQQARFMEVRTKAFSLWEDLGVEVKDERRSQPEQKQKQKLPQLLQIVDAVKSPPRLSRFVKSAGRRSGQQSPLLASWSPRTGSPLEEVAALRRSCDSCPPSLAPIAAFGGRQLSASSSSFCPLPATAMPRCLSPKPKPVSPRPSLGRAISAMSPFSLDTSSPRVFPAGASFLGSPLGPKSQARDWRLDKETFVPAAPATFNPREFRVVKPLD